MGISKGNRKHFLVVIMLAPLLWLCAGCSNERDLVRDHIPPEIRSSRQPAQLNEYRIQPSDVLDVKFFYNPELNETIPVRPDGRISLQLVGDIIAVGLTPSELGALINDKFSRELRMPAATVIVKAFLSQQIYVGGEIERPGVVDLAVGMTALQAVIKAGGFKETAKPEGALLIRKGPDNQPVAYRIDLSKAYRDSNQYSFQLQPSDVVYVPKTWIAEANKFVHEYIEQLLLLKGFYFTWSPAL